MMSDGVRADVLLRLRKLNGQMQGIARMVEADRYCVDVLQQLSAVQSAVEVVSKASPATIWSVALPRRSTVATR